MDARGDLDMRYHHVTVDGALRSGTCRSTLSRTDDGRLAYDEVWRWTTGAEGGGRSRIEELAR
jgi:hypothetical protein